VCIRGFFLAADERGLARIFGFNIVYCLFIIVLGSAIKIG